jgi:hypothetical protein
VVKSFEPHDLGSDRGYGVVVVAALIRLNLNPHPLRTEGAAPRCELLGDGGGGAGGQVGGEWVGWGVFIPEDAEDVPAVLVVEELDGIDAAGEGFFVVGVAGFVAAEDLGHVAEAVDFVDDGVFVESVSFEIGSGAVDVVVDIQQARGVVGVFFGDRGQAGVFREEGAETVPIAIAGGAGNDGVEGGEDRVEGFYVGWVGGGRLGLCLRDGLRGRLGGGGDGERESQSE